MSLAKWSGFVITAQEIWVRMQGRSNQTQCHQREHDGDLMFFGEIY